MFAVSWIPLVGVVCALAAAALIFVVVAGPSRHIRAEERLDEEVETRLLLGEDPDEIDRDLADREETPAPVAELRRDEAM